MPKANRTGRSKDRLPDFTPMLHHVMDSAAYRSLTPLAQCLYWLVQRRAGYKGARNGDVFLSVREVAAHFGVTKNTAAAAFHLLQARGFIRPTHIGRLGISGEGRATTWLLTDWPTANGHAASRDFLAWSPNHDFPVEKGRPPRRRMQKPVPLRGTACPSEEDEGAPRGRRVVLACPSQRDDGAVIEVLSVPLRDTPKELPGAWAKRRGTAR